MKSFDRELVSGNVVRSVWKLAWPAVLLRLIDGLHSVVDHILVGQFVGHEGNAAVGAAWLLFLVVMLLLVSLFQGMVVLASRYSGMQDRANLSDVVYQTLITTVYLIIFFIAPVGYFAAPYLLQLVNIRPEVEADALPYLRIMFTCSAPLFLNLLVTSAFQASGDAKTPLLLGVLTTTINIILSATLITGLGPFPALGTPGAALATALAPTVSIIIAFTLVYRGKTIIQRPPVYRLTPQWPVIKSIARIGGPTGVQAILLNLAGVIVFRKIGALEHSAAAQAAFTICYTQIFSLVTWASFGLRVASATLMGQNLGAGDASRGRRSVYVAAGMGMLWGMVLGVVFWFFPEPLLWLFDAADEPVVGFGVSLLRFSAVSGMFLAAGLALTGGLQGAGETKIPMYIAFVSQIVIMLGLLQIFDWLDVLTANHIWFAVMTSHICRWFITQIVFTFGAWEKGLAQLRRTEEGEAAATRMEGNRL